MGAVGAKLGDLFCEYKSIRFIRVRDKRLSVVYYSLLLLVLLYIVLYTLILRKGYQEQDEVAGTTSIKVKGSASIGTNLSSIGTTNADGITNTFQVLDAMDLIRPANEENAFFITTALTVTKNQTQRVCDGLAAESPACSPSDTSNCSNSNADLLYYDRSSYGVYTGQCGTNSVCQLYSWCPLEDDRVVDVVENIGNLTVFLKTDVSFDKFQVYRSNTMDVERDGKPIFGYNLFTVNDILSDATDGEITDYKQIAEKGAIILISSQWNCNLDRSVKYCNPQYRFSRIDSNPDTISSGYNFRAITYDVHKEHRMLEKLRGIRVIIITEGEGGMFSLFALGITFGAGMAYLSIATVMTDIVMEKFLPQSKTYVEYKHRNVSAAEVLRRDVEEEEKERAGDEEMHSLVSTDSADADGGRGRAANVAAVADID